MRDNVKRPPEYPVSSNPWRITGRVHRVAVLRRDDTVQAIDVVKMAHGLYSVVCDFGHESPAPPTNDFATVEDALANAEKRVAWFRENGAIDADESELPLREPESTHVQYTVEISGWLLDAGLKKKYIGKRFDDRYRQRHRVRIRK